MSERASPTLPAATETPSGEAGLSVVAGCTAARHGTAAAYRRGCRCDLARRAVSRYEKQRLLDTLAGRSRTLPNIGAVRRLQALRALGYPTRTLAARIGVDERNIARWPHRTWISRTHHDAVCRVYAELSSTRGPDERARRHAARMGWLPPICLDDDLIDYKDYNPHDEFCKDEPDVDDVAVERFVAGDRDITLNRAEKHAVFLHMVSRGDTPTAAARALGLNGIYARKYAADLGLNVMSPSNDEADTDDLKETG